MTFLCQILFSNFKKAFVGEVEINPPTHFGFSGWCVAGILCLGAISGKGAAGFPAAAMAHRVTVRQKEAPGRVMDQTVSPKAGQRVILLFTESVNR